MNAPHQPIEDRYRPQPSVCEPIIAAGTVFGIQGGEGSFNEEAVRFFIREHGVQDAQVEYLYTSENVMAAVASGKIERGQCAIYNSAGGWVDETTDALEKYPVKVVEEFEIKIAHALMLRPDQDLSEIDTIMCHPQVFAQCRKNLAEKYPYLRQLSGEGDLIDNAKTAEALALHKLPDTVAVMGSKALAEIYGLEVVEDNLQDLQENFTRFIHVVRGDNA
jgi:prephenate dehydratase